MIHIAVDFLQTVLNDYLLQKLPGNGTEGGSSTGPQKVVFPKIDADPPTFHPESINLLMINLEEERLLKTPNPYTQLSQEGIINSVSPPLRLELMLLFAAKFSNYSTGLKHLSYTIQFFQANPVFSSRQFPSLPIDVDKLNMEFYSMNSTQKNEIWSSLKTAYLPSIVYKLKMLVYQEDIPSLEGEITEAQINLNQT